MGSVDLLKEFVHNHFDVPGVKGDIREVGNIMERMQGDNLVVIWIFTPLYVLRESINDVVLSLKLVFVLGFEVAFKDLKLVCEVVLNYVNLSRGTLSNLVVDKKVFRIGNKGEWFGCGMNRD